ncbi:MAG: hypothetical protein K0S47_3939 [Herbinix sp.]|jgi:hypothetical protein|nr:hypothetical protein [Herbinix sp.]
MDRILMVRQHINRIIQSIKSDEERRIAYVHTYGVAQCAAMIAAKRGLNSELAYISGLLHDIYTCFTGSSLCHAISGAEMVRPIIRDMHIFTYEEKEIILSAIFYHSNKERVHDEYDEVLKDADVLQPFLNDACFRTYYLFIPRLTKVLEELGLTALPAVYGQEPDQSKVTYNRSLFADIAENIASQNVCGERDNTVFMNIIKYYPEPSAFSELKNYWCAAFVYHCALEAGLELPIRLPPIKNRFAGVGSWYEWATANHFCFYEKDGFIPSRGDIVIYNNIIPPENKEQGSAWHDHIGVVLSCENEFLVVAEGNINNQNVSGIIKRKRDNTIGCFVRIPNEFTYDGWNCDYKAYLKTLKL